MPKAFLIEFQARKHPETGARWALPTRDENVLGPNKSGTPSSSKRGKSGYVRCSRDAVESLSRKNAFKKLNLPVSIWREDMADHALGVLQRSASEYLDKHADHCSSLNSENPDIIAIILDHDGQDEYNVPVLNVTHLLPGNKHRNLAIPATETGCNIFWRLCRVQLYCRNKK
jgi:hypothetical protein